MAKGNNHDPTFAFEPLPRRHFRTIVLDPPWRFSGGTKGRPQHYPRMFDAEIAALGPSIRDLAHPEGANVFVWITSPIDGQRFWQKVFPSWKKANIRHSGRAFVWVKTHARHAKNGPALFVHKSSLHISTGFTTRKNAEDCLLFKVGRPTRARNDIHEIIMAPLREHSRKPDEFFDEVERYCAGPYCELFSREPRKGWQTWGNERGKFVSPLIAESE